jgi:transmembrane sensor
VKHITTPSEELLSNYFSGKCTEEEKQKVLAYLSQLDEEAVSPIMEREWARLETESLDPNSIRERITYQKIRQGISGNENKSNYGYAYRIAASILLLTLFSFIVFRYGEEILFVVDPISQIEIQTQPGSIQLVRLPDGSEVWLNAASKLSYPDRFHKVRKINLEGEAFFKVKRNEKEPFIIQSGIFFTTVLGTSFNVKAYQSDKHIQVSVATGKVAVSVSSDSLYEEAQRLAFLTPDQQITYFPETQSFEMAEIPSDQFIGWIAGQLVFKKASVTEVANTLERWYGKRIEVEGFKPGVSCTFTANFKKGTSLQDILETLVLTQKIEYSVERDRIIIQIDKCLKKQ